MRKNSIPLIIGGLCIIGALNLMCFILRATSVCRIGCSSIGQMIMQNRLYVIGFILSFSGAFLLTKVYRKKYPKEDKDNFIEVDEN